MHHDDDVGSALESEAITGLLIPAVAAIDRMDHGLNSERARHRGRAIRAEVVDQNDIVDQVPGDFRVGRFEGAGRIVGRQYHGDALAI